MCKGVIFDMDGVLIDSHLVHKKVWAQFLTSLNRPVSEADLDFVLDGRKREEIMLHFLGNVPAEQLREYGQRKDEIYAGSAGSMKTIPGVEEFLGRLEKAGLPMAVATSASFARARGTLDELGILPRFSALVTANDVLNGKPDPEIFLKAAERLGLAADSLLVVEDAISGVRAAKTAGMKCLGIAADGRREKLRAAGADHVVPDYLGLDLLEIQMLF